MAWRRVVVGARSAKLGRGLAGLAAGVGLAYFLDPVRGRGRRASAIDRTRRAARAAAQRVPELAGGGALRTEGAWPRGAEAVAVAVGSAAAARALLGRRLLGIPALLAGAALARGAVRGAIFRRAHGGAGHPPSIARRRAQRDAARAERRAGERRRDRASHTGAWHPEPDVVEVKSPAALEPGIAHASPEPTFPDRVSRRGGAAGVRARGRPAPAPERDRDPSLHEPLPRAGFVSPSPGAAVRPGELGAFPGPGEAAGDGEDGSGTDED